MKEEGGIFLPKRSGSRILIHETRRRNTLCLGNKGSRSGRGENLHLASTGGGKIVLDNHVRMLLILTDGSECTGKKI